MAQPQRTEPDGTGRALVCILTYDEKDNVGPIVRAVREAVPAADVLVVDDEPPDGTGKLSVGRPTPFRGRPSHPGAQLARAER